MSGTKIALIGNQAFGLANFRGAMIQRLVARGYEVFALVPDYTPETRAAVSALGATPVDHRLPRLGLNPLIDVRAALQLYSTLRDINPDIVLSFTVKAVVYGTLAAKFAGVKRRYSLIEGLGHAFIHSDTFKGNLLRLGVSTLYRLSLGVADRTLFLNADDEREFVGQRLVPKNRSLVVGTIGVDLDEWSFAPPVTTPMAFLFIGRLLYEKGIAEFIAAARRVRERYPSARFVVVGDVDSNPSSLRPEIVREWVSEGLVEWPGHTDVKPRIARSSVFVLPSYREGFPRATQEAMAMGRPVITTDVPGCRETVEDGVNGFLVPPRDPEALAEAMCRFLDQPSLVAAMGAESRRIAEQHFDIDAATNRLLTAIGIR